jgi:hypothetical protein
VDAGHDHRILFAFVFVHFLTVTESKASVLVAGSRFIFFSPGTSPASERQAFR